MDLTQMQQQMVQYFNQGKYTQAIALGEQCIDRNPNLLSNYFYLGLAWLLQGEESQAQAIWLSAIAQANPEEIDLYLAELANLLASTASEYLNWHNFDLAERIYWQILELDADRVEAHYYLGHILAQQGNFDEAIASWQKAIDINPTLVDAYQNQGCVFQKLEDFTEAISCYLKALAIQPDSQVNYNLGLCFSQVGRLDEAIAYFQAAIELQPDYTQAYGDLGNALLALGKLDEAISCFQKAIQIQPKFAQAYYKLINTSIIQNDSLPDKYYLLQNLHSPQKPSDTYFYLGKALLAGGKQNQAIVCFQKAIEIKPELAPRIYELTALISHQNQLTIEPVVVPEIIPPNDFYEFTEDWY